MAVNNLTTKKNGVKVKVEQTKKPQKLGACLRQTIIVVTIFNVFLLHYLYALNKFFVDVNRVLSMYL